MCESRVHAGDPADSTDAATLAAIREIGGVVRPLATGWEVEFHLRGRALTDEGLARVAALKDVVSLNLRDTQITGSGLVHLKDLTRLRWLHLERTQIGDEGTENLSGLRNLEYLNLYATKISDELLGRLTGLKRLKRLYVWQTNVTDEGVAALVKDLPELKIVRGVDFNKLSTYADIVGDIPQPTEDLQWIAVSRASDAPKSNNGINTQVFFENKSRRRVKLYWISYGNELKLYAELEPGATRQQNSYANNSWLITDENDSPLAYFIVTEDISRAVIPGPE